LLLLNLVYDIASVHGQRPQTQFLFKYKVFGSLRVQNLNFVTIPFVLCPPSASCWLVDSLCLPQMGRQWRRWWCPWEVTGSLELRGTQYYRDCLEPDWVYSSLGKICLLCTWWFWSWWLLGAVGRYLRRTTPHSQGGRVLRPLWSHACRGTSGVPRAESVRQHPGCFGEGTFNYSSGLDRIPVLS